MILNDVLTAKCISLFQTVQMHVVPHLYGGWEQNDEEHLRFTMLNHVKAVDNGRNVIIQLQKLALRRAGSVLSTLL